TRPSPSTTRTPPAPTTCAARTGSPASSPGSTWCRPAWSPPPGGGPTSGTPAKSPGKSTRSAASAASADPRVTRPGGPGLPEQADPAGELRSSVPSAPAGSQTSLHTRTVAVGFAGWIGARGWIGGDHGAQNSPGSPNPPGSYVAWPPHGA